MGNMATVPLPSPRSGLPSTWGGGGDGYLTRAFWGAHKWAVLLRNSLILGAAQKRRQNQKWLPHLCLLRAQRWAVPLRNPLIHGGPQIGGQNQSWLP